MVRCPTRKALLILLNRDWVVGVLLAVLVVDNLGICLRHLVVAELDLLLRAVAVDRQAWAEVVVDLPLEDLLLLDHLLHTSEAALLLLVVVAPVAAVVRAYHFHTIIVVLPNCSL